MALMSMIFLINFNNLTLTMIYRVELPGLEAPEKASGPAELGQRNEDSDSPRPFGSFSGALSAKKSLSLPLP